MGYWNSRGLRGSFLEDMINLTNELYREKSLGLIQKIPTPIKPITMDKSKGVITLAYFDQKSTVDYIGVVQGIPVCFDAKETASNSLPLANVHGHQIVFMNDFVKQGGEAFFIVYFKKYERYFLMPIEFLMEHVKTAEAGGRKSIPYSAFEKIYTVPFEGGMYINYLKALEKYLIDKQSC
ncbi:MAG: Holliday junction resolvase RecU [Cellulosilyticaceae bacterium]